MRIVIDLQGAQTEGSKDRGVGRYTNDLVKAFVSVAKSHDVFLVLNGAFFDTIDEIKARFINIIPEENILTWQQPPYLVPGIRADLKARRFRFELIREAFIQTLSPDLIWSTNLQEGFCDNAVTSVKKFNAKTIHCTTLHDITPLLCLDKYLRGQTVRQWYDEKINHTKCSDIILTVSNTSKNEIKNHLDIPSNKIFVIKCAHDNNLFNNKKTVPKNLLNSLGISKKFIMYSGADDEHKNLELIFSSLSQLNCELRNNIQLILVGKSIKNNEERYFAWAKKYNLNRRDLLLLGFVPDETLAFLLASCAAFVFPSLHEGFGLPPLEAMACGVPVIASNAASLPEVVGNQEALFDPHDSKALSSLLEKLLTSSEFRMHLVKSGIEQAQKFSWEKSALNLLQLFESICEKKKLNAAHKAITNKNILDKLILEISSSADKMTRSELIKTAFVINENIQPDERKPHVFVDMSEQQSFIDSASHRATGIQRVARAIAKALLLKRFSNYEVRLIYTIPFENQFYYANKLESEFKSAEKNTCDGKEAVDLYHGDVLLFLDLYPPVAISHKNYFHNLRNKGCKIFFTLHDMLPILHKDFFWPTLCKEFENWLNIISCTNGAICVSRSVADEFNNWRDANKVVSSLPFKLGWFHLGSDIENAVPSKGVPENHIDFLNKISNATSFLMVGTLEPKKDHLQVIEAFEKLWSKQYDFNLVLVGKLDRAPEALETKVNEHRELNKRLFWLQNVSDEYLELIYKSSTCLIAASQAEGFGLPLIEAARHKTPILARKIPVFEEIAGDFASYFIADAPDELASSILHWSKMFKNGNHPKSDKMPILTWEKSCDQLIDVIFNNKWYKTLT